MVSLVNACPRIPFPLGFWIRVSRRGPWARFWEAEWSLQSDMVAERHRGAWLNSLFSTLHLVFLPSCEPHWRTVSHYQVLSHGPSVTPQRQELPRDSPPAPPFPSCLGSSMGWSSQISLQAPTCPPRSVLHSFLKGMTLSLTLQLPFLDLSFPWSSHNCVKFNFYNKYLSPHSNWHCFSVEPRMIQLYHLLDLILLPRTVHHCQFWSCYRRARQGLEGCHGFSLSTSSFLLAITPSTLGFLLGYGFNPSHIGSLSPNKTAWGMWSVSFV